MAFKSEATNLVPDDTNGYHDVFVHDRFLHITRRVSVASDGAQAAGSCYHAAVSQDGSRVVFASWADNLDPGATSPYPDGILRTREFEPDGYCFGAAALCPCGNAGGASRGCGNSTGAGALLGWSGSASDSADDLVLEASSLPPSRPALAFVGTGGLDGAQAIPFGDGLRCVVGSISRLGIEQSSSSGAASWGPNLNALGNWEPGSIRWFQAWYRDPVGGPCGSGFNLTNGLGVEFQG